MTEAQQNEHSTSFCRRKDERPAEILNAALKEFTLNGFSATRLDDVAKRAGICKGTIYLYFKSKEELFVEMVRDKLVPHIEKLEEINQQSNDSAKEIFTELLTSIYKELLSTDARYIPKLIISEGTRFPELAEFYFNEIISRIHNIIKEVINKGVQSGEFRPAALKWEQQAILGPALTAAIWKTIFDEYEPMDLDAYLKTHIELVLQGLEK